MNHTVASINPLKHLVTAVLVGIMRNCFTRVESLFVSITHKNGKMEKNNDEIEDSKWWRINKRQHLVGIVEAITELKFLNCI